MSVLQTHYHAYVGRVSSPVWALSLETASVLYALCNVLRPAAILDLGSGFSSVTFRLYAQSAGHECIIHSVDDQLQWLERSGQFLQSINLSTEGLMLLPELYSQVLGGYDLILHDLGNMQLRAETLGIVLAQRSATGWVMLDDMHKEPYGSAARAACASANLTLFSLQELTRDQYGRFACLASAPTSVRS